MLILLFTVVCFVTFFTVVGFFVASFNRFLEVSPIFLQLQQKHNMSTTLLQDTFKIHDVNPDGTKFDKVTRIVCKESQRHSFKMVLDLYTELYDVKKSEKLDLVLATDKTLIVSQYKKRPIPTW